MSAMAWTRPLLGKVVIAGVLRTLTGLHIGGAKETMEIGAIDLPVIREQKEGVPYVPGSSLKGKMRSLAERVMVTEDPSKRFDRWIARDQVSIHVCKTAELARNCKVCRVFGSSGERREDKNFPARLFVRDGPMMDYSRASLEEAPTDLPYAEMKVENALDRITSAATIRRLERVPAGTDFRLDVVYSVEDLADLEADLAEVLMRLRMIEDDALGGHGSRGSGRVAFFFSQMEARKIGFYAGDAGSSLEVFPTNPKLADEASVTNKVGFLSVAEVHDELKKRANDVRDLLGRS